MHSLFFSRLDQFIVKSALMLIIVLAFNTYLYSDTENQQNDYSPTFISEIIDIPKGANHLADGQYGRSHKTAPQYPRDARRKRIPGIVMLGYFVNEDGTTTGHKVIDEFPKNYGFAESAMTTAKEFRYARNANADNSLYPKFVLHRSKFTFKKRRSGIKQVGSIVTEANKKNGRAQYVLSQLAESIYNVKIPIKKKNILLYEAAKNNYAHAQLLLGLKLYSGVGVERSKVKARYWLDRALKNDSELAKEYIEVLYPEALKN